MPTGYLPASENELLEFARNFSDHIGADAPAYGLTVQQSEQYAISLARLADAVAVVNNPDTATSTARIAKSDAKRHLVNASRMLVKVAQAWPPMTDEKRGRLRITIPDRDPTPVGPPTTEPMVEVRGVRGHRVGVELRAADGRRRKPRGVRGANVYSFVGPAPSPDPADWRNEGATTRTTIDIDFPASVPPGASVWIAANWFSPTMHTGLVGQPVQAHVNAGGMARAA